MTCSIWHPSNLVGRTKSATRRLAVGLKCEPRRRQRSFVRGLAALRQPERVARVGVDFGRASESADAGTSRWPSGRGKQSVHIVYGNVLYRHSILSPSAEVARGEGEGTPSPPPLTVGLPGPTPMASFESLSVRIATLQVFLTVSSTTPLSPSRRLLGLPAASRQTSADTRFRRRGTPPHGSARGRAG